MSEYKGILSTTNQFLQGRPLFKDMQGLYSLQVVDHSQEDIDRQQLVDSLQRGTHLDEAFIQNLSTNEFDYEISNIRGIFHSTRTAIKDVLDSKKDDIKHRIAKRKSEATSTERRLEAPRLEREARLEILHDVVLEPKVLETLLDEPQNQELVEMMNSALKIDLKKPYNLAKRPQARLFLRTLFFGLSVTPGRNAENDLLLKRQKFVKNVSNSPDESKLKALRKKVADEGKQLENAHKLVEIFEKDSLDKRLVGMEETWSDISSFAYTIKDLNDPKFGHQTLDGRLRSLNGRADILRKQLSDSAPASSGRKLTELEKELYELQNPSLIIVPGQSPKGSDAERVKRISQLESEISHMKALAELEKVDTEISALESNMKDRGKFERLIEDRKSIENQFRTDLLQLYEAMRDAVQIGLDMGETLTGDPAVRVAKAINWLRQNKRVRDPKSMDGLEELKQHYEFAKAWLMNTHLTKLPAISELISKFLSRHINSLEIQKSKADKDLASETKSHEQAKSMSDEDFGANLLMAMAKENPALKDAPESTLRKDIKINLINDELDLVTRGSLGESFNASKTNLKLGLSRKRQKRLSNLIGFHALDANNKRIGMSQEYELSKLTPDNVTKMIAEKTMSVSDAVHIYAALAIEGLESHPIGQIIRRHLIAYLTAKFGQKDALLRFADFVKEASVDTLGYEAKYNNHSFMRSLVSVKIDKLKAKEKKARRRAGQISMSDAAVEKAKEKGSLGFWDSTWESAKVIASKPRAYLSRAGRDTGEFLGRNTVAGLGNALTLAGAPVVNTAGYFLLDIKDDVLTNLVKLRPIKFLTGTFKTALKGVFSPLYYPLAKRSKLFHRNKYFKLKASKYSVGTDMHEVYAKEADELKLRREKYEDLLNMYDHKIEASRTWRDFKWDDVETGSKQLQEAMAASNDNAISLAA